MATKYTTAGELTIFGFWAVGMVLGYLVMKSTGWYGIAGGALQVAIPGILFALLGRFIALDVLKLKKRQEKRGREERERERTIDFWFLVTFVAIGVLLLGGAIYLANHP